MTNSKIRLILDLMIKIFLKFNESGYRRMLYLFVAVSIVFFSITMHLNEQQRFILILISVVFCCQISNAAERRKTIQALYVARNGGGYMRLVKRVIYFILFTIAVGLYVMGQEASR